MRPEQQFRFSPLQGNLFHPVRRTRFLEPLLCSQVCAPPRLCQTPEFNCLQGI